jgi:hypothetical protein
VKLLALAALTVLLAPKADVRFEADGLRVDGALVTGRVLELKGAGSSALLASGSSVEALTSSLEIRLTADRTLVLEPGLRVARAEGGYLFTSHRSGAIRFTASEESVAVAGPVLVAATPEGWQIGDRKVAGARLQAGVPGQDDTETNLDKMMKSKEKMQSGAVPKLGTRTTRLYSGGDPLTPANGAGSIAVRQIGRVTPDGAP